MTVSCKKCGSQPLAQQGEPIFHNNLYPIKEYRMKCMKCGNKTEWHTYLSDATSEWVEKNS